MVRPITWFSAIESISYSDAIWKLDFLDKFLDKILFLNAPTTWILSTKKSLNVWYSLSSKEMGFLNPNFLFFREGEGAV